ncbi:branched-chain amino acid dehydrogenase [Clostridium novyi A str. 4552]|uniref:Branched-chain amino acid dehydrogenase n=1 Tax=Clostridium novyi A str. 4552 TaxID=1444289 RepID=A0A0A0ICM4_CLONO|nr:MULTISPECIES: 3-oxoacid CoA-transferase subunit A [Clostridium]EDS76966.1 acetate CoA-transferase alpha subunit [Clostridium botulinum C str. Eklund]KEH97139.1 branched-chain amino acid dehydrogenase [Clostridium botulinum C/D str. BKT12695]KGM98268.1 branched-chain amino acid dehydrogenase [Clostridium novyi A str. 4552]NEZ50156.1 CoA transferase subunit A [Clostridium botulinum]
MAVITTTEEAVKNIKDGMRVAIGGFFGIGSPVETIDAVVKSGVKDLTLISVAGGSPGGGRDINKLVRNRQIKRFIGTHIGTDKDFMDQYNKGEVKVEFNPMGTWIERLRAGGAGLGGIITPTGLGTEVEEHAEKITVEGKEYLLYPPLKADIAIIKGYRADKYGNVEYRGISLNTNPVLATAADIVIAEVDEIVEPGEIEATAVGTQGIFVDYIVKSMPFKERTQDYEEYWKENNKLR